MINHYISEYQNKVHILNVTVSKHFFLKKDGSLKFQKKPLELKLQNMQYSEKNHIIHYILTDHFSKFSYIEMYTNKTYIPIENFLYRAWGNKEKYDFHGLPENLIITKDVISIFPTIQNFIDKRVVNFIPSASGFQSSASVIKSWENKLSYYTVRFTDKFKLFQENMDRFIIQFNNVDHNYYQCWVTGLSEHFIRNVPSWDNFSKYFD